jgi:hypothetical protein
MASLSAFLCAWLATVPLLYEFTWRQVFESNGVSFGESSNLFLRNWDHLEVRGTSVAPKPDETGLMWRPVFFLSSFNHCFFCFYIKFIAQNSHMQIESPQQQRSKKNPEKQLLPRGVEPRPKKALPIAVGNPTHPSPVSNDL